MALEISSSLNETQLTHNGALQDYAKSLYFIYIEEKRRQK